MRQNKRNCHCIFANKGCFFFCLFFISPGGDFSSAPVHLSVSAAHLRSLFIKVSILQRDLFFFSLENLRIQKLVEEKTRKDKTQK